MMMDDGVVDKENGQWSWNSNNKKRCWARTRETRKATDAAHHAANREEDNARRAANHRRYEQLHAKLISSLSPYYYEDINMFKGVNFVVDGRLRRKITDDQLGLNRKGRDQAHVGSDGYV